VVVFGVLIPEPGNQASLVLIAAQERGASLATTPLRNTRTGWTGRPETIPGSRSALLALLPRGTDPPSTGALQTLGEKPVVLREGVSHVGPYGRA
jgi:hypothetical protein